MKKQLLFIIDTLQCGGAEKSLISLLPLIDYNKYDVDLIIFKCGGVFEKFVPSQVKIIDHRMEYRKNTIWKKVLNKAVDAYLSPQMRFNKKKHNIEILWKKARWIYGKFPKQYDVAIAYQQGLPTFFLADRVEAKKKIAWINADLYDAGYDMDYCRQFYERMNYVVAVSPRLLNLLAERSPWIKTKLCCIYDIVNPDLINRMSGEAIDEMPKIEGVVRLVTAGRLATPKNHLLAVEAARILRDKGLRFQWFFVGEGETRSQIEKSILNYGLQDNVVLLGFRDNPYPYISQADIYVQTSSHEGFCLTIAEAKILHKPLVSTNFDVVKDQIIDRENGLIAEMTPQSVAEKILEMLHDESLRNHIVQNLDQEKNRTAVTEVEKFNAMLAAD